MQRSRGLEADLMQRFSENHMTAHDGLDITFTHVPCHSILCSATRLISAESTSDLKPTRAWPSW